VIPANSQETSHHDSGAGARNGIAALLPEFFHSLLALRLAVLFTLLILLGTAFRWGWTRLETDFPNYYTAATLLRQHQPLRNYYDWTCFAREMSYAGNGMIIGGYTPQTPLTVLPILALTRFAPQTAKRIWLIFNLGFLWASVWLLSRMTRFRAETIWLLAFCGYFSLRNNFRYGQYYIFLLFLLTLAFYFLDRKSYALGGFLTGIAFALKLYGGPFLLYFAARRQWKALLGMVVAGLILLGVALVLFGPADVHYYATQILPRSLEGGSIDPYNPGVPTLSTMLMRSFVSEAELNPHPLWNAPWLFFFLRTFTALTIVAFLFLGTSTQHNSERRDFAWFVIAVLLLSTSTASYTFIILLLPLVLLLEESGPPESIFLVASYILLTLPLHPIRLFPKVWLLIALFVFVGYRSWRGAPRQIAVAAVALAALIAFVDAKRHLASYASEPEQQFARVAAQNGAIFSAFPVVSRAGFFFQSMGKDRYVLRWLHDSQNEELSFEGQALHPRLAADGTAVLFELVENGSSSMMEFDPATGKATPREIPVPADFQDAVTSPDGKWVAFSATRHGPMQVWLREVSSGQERQLTGGNCNSSSPAWELDSKGIVFASDCSRAFGLPALYRARLTDSD
jgi:Glycosyltransferase family 87/WD40-like Beta Propeller Repeat